MIIFIN